MKKSSPAESTYPTPLLEAEKITKRFPSVTANQHIDLEIKEGEVHCLLGENGAGKTTLAECLFGYYQPDQGVIRFKGKPVKLSSPNEAIQLGIGMVHQHFMLVEPHSVIENIILGSNEKGLFLNRKKAEEKISQLCKQYGVDLNLQAKIWQLSVGEQQWVEILKALYVGIDLLILDEPTASLTPQESDRLFTILKRMKAEGLSILFITHKLQEVMDVSDRVTVLRRGQKVGTVLTKHTFPKELAHMMVGREVLFQVQKEQTESGKALIKVRNLEALDDMRHLALRGVSFTIHEGEILGIAGVAGNGQKELMEVLMGVRRAKGGSARIKGVESLKSSTRKIMNKGVGHIPSDRIKQGLVMNFKIYENMILGYEWNHPFRKGLVLHEKAIREFAAENIENFDIITPSMDQMTKNLSGGNLQKLIVAREFGTDPDILLADRPSRGLDVGAVEYVHKKLLEQRKEGVGILLISEDLDEIFKLSDRIAVVFDGQIMGMYKADEVDRETIGMLMAGVREENKA